MWLCEAIYQKRHLEIPTLGIFELPWKLQIDSTTLAKNV
jgi:hypothetical protein